MTSYETSWFSLSFFIFVFEPQDLAYICWSWSVSEDLAGEGSLLQITDTNLVATKSFFIAEEFFAHAEDFFVEMLACPENFYFC